MKYKDSGLKKIFSRGLLITTLEKDVLLTSINVFDNGSIKLVTKNWNEYWLPVLNLKHKKVDEVLKHLYCAWNKYIDSSFNNSYRSVYCFYYFHLLELLIQIQTNIIHELWVNALQTVLGFECFSIFNDSMYQQSFAAGTCSLRNPCYLLSKLKMPKSLDDPQYLPLITISDTEKPELYYHYRQYALSPSSPLSLLLYPSVSIERRSESFALMNMLVRDLKNGIDPRTAERAKRIYDGIIRSILQMYMYNGGKLDLEIIDIGAGTGSLVVAIYREIRKHHVNCIFRLRFLDLELADTTRYFRKDLLASLDGLEYWVDDYRDWHGYSQVSFQPKILRISIVSKLLNNLSHFSTRTIPLEELRSFANSWEDNLISGKYSPTSCLKPEEPESSRLLISNSRISLYDGRTFPSFSLSSFFRGLHILMKLGDGCLLDTKGIFLPIRSFNPNSLLTEDGRSIIGLIAEYSDFAVIEDADLRSQDLLDHKNQRKIDNCSIIDMTKTLKLEGNYCYTIKADRALDPTFSGERLW